MKIPLFIVIVSFIFILSCHKGKESSPDTEKSEQTKSEAVQKETTPQAEKTDKEKPSEAVEAVKEETAKASDELKEESAKVVQAEAEKKASQTAGPGKEETEKAAEDVKEEVVKEEVVKEVSGPDGAQLFQSKGCAGCHRPDNDVVGPSLKTIAKVYKEKNGNLIEFLKGQTKAIVDPKKAAMMKPLLNPIKSLSDEELKALADYMLQ